MTLLRSKKRGNSIKDVSHDTKKEKERGGEGRRPLPYTNLRKGEGKKGGGPLSTIPTKKKGP